MVEVDGAVGPSAIGAVYGALGVVEVNHVDAVDVRAGKAVSTRELTRRTVYAAVLAGETTIYCVLTVGTDRVADGSALG